jgi:hypothetical protein
MHKHQRLSATKRPEANGLAPETEYMGQVPDNLVRVANHLKASLLGLPIETHKAS